MPGSCSPEPTPRPAYSNGRDPGAGMPGVVEVVTSADVPVNEYGLHVRSTRSHRDQSTPGGRRWPATSRGGKPTISHWWWPNRSRRPPPEPRRSSRSGNSCRSSPTPKRPSRGPAPPSRERTRTPTPTTTSGFARATSRRVGSCRRRGRRHLRAALQEHAYLQPEAAARYIDERDGSPSRSPGNGSTRTRNRSPTPSICRSIRSG